MAKKKVAHSNQQQKDSKDSTAHSPDVGRVTESEPMAQKQDPTEKLQSLKSLNSLLLKETVERRQQVESLELAKTALEAELTRFGAEKRGLETELSFDGHQNVALELEKAVLCIFLATRLSEVFAQVGTLKGQWDFEILGLREKVGELADSLENERAILSQVIQERDLLKSDCGSWMEKANRMRENLNEMEKARRSLDEKFEKLAIEHGKLLEENNKGNRALEVAIQVRDSVRSNLQAAAEEIDVLNRKIVELVRENKGMEVEKSGREVKITELEKEIVMLNEDLESLRKEEKKLQDELVEMGKRSEEASEKEKEMARQIEALVEVGKEKEASIEMLRGEKDSVEKSLKMARKELKEKEQLMEGIVRKKIEIEEANYCNQNEIAGLNKEVGELRNEISALQISCGDETEKNRALLSEINVQKEVLDRVYLERDDVKKGLDEERQSAVHLRSKIAELENRIEEATGELMKLMSEHKELIVQKDEAMKRLEKVRKEKESMEEKLSGAEHSIANLKGEMELAAVKSDRALAFVRNAASMFNQAKEKKVAGKGGGGLVVCETKAEEDIQPYERELEIIKNAFQMKESMMEDLKRQLDVMQDSIMKEQKSKGLWKLLSSATTLFAAAFVAYLARGR